MRACERVVFCRYSLRCLHVHLAKHKRTSPTVRYPSPTVETNRVFRTGVLFLYVQIDLFILYVLYSRNNFVYVYVCALELHVGEFLMIPYFLCVGSVWTACVNVFVLIYMCAWERESTCIYLCVCEVYVT